MGLYILGWEKQGRVEIIGEVCRSKQQAEESKENRPIGSMLTVFELVRQEAQQPTVSRK